MKKIYSLFAAVILAAGVNAQTVFSATFDDLNGTGGNDGAFSGNVGTSSLATYTANGWVFSAAGGAQKSIKAGTGSVGGSVQTPVISPQLAGTATLSFRAAGFSSDNTTLFVQVVDGGNITTNSFALANSAWNTYTATITDATASTKLRFYTSAGNDRFFIDDITVSLPTASSIDITTGKANLVKNTVVSNNIIFGEQADIQIVNANGQVVKTASVKENTSLDVTSLAKGMYVVTGTVNGKSVSQKIIKK